MDKIKIDIQNLSRNYLDIIINKENNTHYIEIYGLPNWGALNKKEYEEQEKFLSELYIEDESYTMYASYDVSGFDYWMIKQEEPNYININIEIKEIINSKGILKTLEKWFILIDENITEMNFKKGVSTLLGKRHFSIDNQLVTKIAFLRKRANL